MSRLLGERVYSSVSEDEIFVVEKSRLYVFASLGTSVSKNVYVNFSDL